MNGLLFDSDLFDARLYDDPNGTSVSVPQPPAVVPGQQGGAKEIVWERRILALQPALVTAAAGSFSLSVNHDEDEQDLIVALAQILV